MITLDEAIKLRKDAVQKHLKEIDLEIRKAINDGEELIYYDIGATELIWPVIRKLKEYGFDCETHQEDICIEISGWAK